MDKPEAQPGPIAGRLASPTISSSGPMPARMYEVILPKKLGYFGKVQEVLEDLFDEQAIRAVPFIQQVDQAAAAAIGRVRRGSLDQDPVPGLARLFDLRDGRPLPLAARARSTSGCW